MSIKKRASLERVAGLTGILAGVALYAYFYWVTRDNDVAQGFMFAGVVVAFVIIGKIGSSLLGYLSDNSWGRLDGQKLTFRKKAFADAFLTLNPSLS